MPRCDIKFFCYHFYNLELQREQRTEPGLFLKETTKKLHLGATLYKGSWMTVFKNLIVQIPLCPSSSRFSSDVYLFLHG